MNLTGGQYKSRIVKVPDNVKPTLSKVRESIFNILQQFEFDSNNFLDMFSGSGIIGLEAISRGYKVTGLEINQKNIDIIKQNYISLNLKPNIIRANALNYKTDDRYEIIYVDPPWQDDYTNIIKKAESLLEKNGIIIVEYDNTRNISIQDILNKNNINLKIIKSKKYGRCLIELLTNCM